MPAAMDLHSWITNDTTRIEQVETLKFEGWQEDFKDQLNAAVTYLHNNIGWIHGDIKPDNILIRHMPQRVDGKTFVLKLADFDTAYRKEEWSEQQGGTPHFQAPKPTDKKELERLDTTGHSDMWSVMCVEYAIDHTQFLTRIKDHVTTLTTEQLRNKFETHHYKAKVNKWIYNAAYGGNWQAYFS